MNTTSKRLNKAAIPGEKPEQQSSLLGPCGNPSSQYPQTPQPLGQRGWKANCKVLGLNIHSNCTESCTAEVLQPHSSTRLDTAYHSKRSSQVRCLSVLPRPAFGIRWDCKGKFFFSSWTFSTNLTTLSSIMGILIPRQLYQYNHWVCTYADIREPFCIGTMLLGTTQSVLHGCI